MTGLCQISPTWMCWCEVSSECLLYVKSLVCSWSKVIRDEQEKEELEFRDRLENVPLDHLEQEGLALKMFEVGCVIVWMGKQAPWDELGFRKGLAIALERKHITLQAESLYYWNVRLLLPYSDEQTDMHDIGATPPNTGLSQNPPRQSNQLFQDGTTCQPTSKHLVRVIQTNNLEACANSVEIKPPKNKHQAWLATLSRLTW